MPSCSVAGVIGAFSYACMGRREGNRVEVGRGCRAMILALVLAQSIASCAATNMNVVISAIAKDRGAER